MTRPRGRAPSPGKWRPKRRAEAAGRPRGKHPSGMLHPSFIFKLLYKLTTRVKVLASRSLKGRGVVSVD